ncbi:MAG: adenylate/guanylate cyclase domain-containing protein [bacterium]
MQFQGVYWIAIQDIGGFTTLSEQLAKKGKKGTEELCGIIIEFFNEAEKKILNCNGRIFKLAGDAYYAIFPASTNIHELKSLGNELLNLPVLRKTNLKTRFVGVRGMVEGDWLDMYGEYKDLLIKGPAMYDLSLLEDKTPAGRMYVISSSELHGHMSLTDHPDSVHKIQYPPAHRPLYIAFLEVPQDFNLIHKITDSFLAKRGNLNLLKWIPGKSTLKALLIAGFPEATGREPEIFVNTFNELKENFKNYELRMGLSSGVVFAGEVRTRKFKEFMLLGDQVNIASRLCTVAPNNGVYLSEEIKKSLRGRFHLIDVGEIRLKGREAKVRVYKPQKRVAEVLNRLLFPHRFVGREKELNKALELIREGKGISFIGDAGMGKSRMLYEVKRRLDQRSIIELSLSPVAPPLFLLKELFKYFPEGDFPELKNYFGGIAQLPVLKVVELLKNLFQTKHKLIVFVEDLHWIENASLMLLKEVLPLPFLMVTSSRPDGEKIIDFLQLKKIFLKNLPSGALINLFKEAQGALPERKLFKFLLGRSQGNPFYFE